MTDGPISDAELQAFVDGRLPEPRRSALDTWLAENPEEAERVAAYRRLAEELRHTFDGVLLERVPTRLVHAARRRRGWPVINALAAAWLVVGVAIGSLAGWELRGTHVAGLRDFDAALTMARRAAIAHAVYSPEVRHPVEVGADEEGHLVAWLSKRLGSPLRAPKLDALGYSLVGGRLLPGENGPAADFMYQRKEGARITLYVRSGMAGNRETAFRFAKEGNVAVFYWVDRKLGYAISSSDISKDELLKVANMVYQQLNF